MIDTEQRLWTTSRNVRSTRKGQRPRRSPEVGLLMTMTLKLSLIYTAICLQLAYSLHSYEALLHVEQTFRNRQFPYTLQAGFETPISGGLPLGISVKGPLLFFFCFVRGPLMSSLGLNDLLDGDWFRAKNWNYAMRRLRRRRRRRRRVLFKEEESSID